jgi:hypothetical protein
MAFMAIFTLLGLFGLTFFLPFFGLVPVLWLICVMYMMNFFLSHYLNRITSSEQRATVLSFKGLSFNMAYGAVGLLYSLLIAFLGPQVVKTHPHLSGDPLEDAIFVESLSLFPWYFLLILTALMIFAHWHLRHTDEHKRVW